MRDKDRKKLLKVSDVAKISHISPDTLRYYDKIDLFKADIVDDNGYRYYRPSSLVDLDLILWLRWNDVSLKKIKKIMKNKSLDETIGTFRAESEKTRRMISLLQNRLKSFDLFLESFTDHKRYGLRKPHIAEFGDRFAVSANDRISPEDRMGYELSLKNILCEIKCKDTYLNSFFGAVVNLHGRGRPAAGESIRAMVLTFLENQLPSGEKIRAGRYAVMHTTGYFCDVCKEIPKLLSFIQDRGLKAGNRCYIMKTWENTPDSDEPGELMELQIPIL